MKTPLIIFLIALVIRLAAILIWQFDGLYGQDPFAYLQQAFAAVDNLPQGQPPPTSFFWPNGYPLLIALLIPIFGKTALAGQLAALLSGSLLASLTYGLTRDLWATEQRPVANRPHVQNGETAGLLAGLIIAVAGQPILSSIVVMADMPALMWATLSAWCFVRATTLKQSHRLSPQKKSTLWLLAAGTTLALAIISRWVYVLIVPALGLYTLFRVYHRRAAWWPLLSAVLGGTLILAPQLWWSLNKPDGVWHSWLLGWRPVNFFQRQFENIDGHFFYQLPIGVYYAQPAGHPAYIFPLLGPAALWGLWRLWRTKQWSTLILLLGWIMPVYLFLGGIPYQNFRFGLSHYVPIVVLTGFGLGDLLHRRSASPGKRSLRLIGGPTVLKAIIALSLLGMLAWAYPMLDSFLTTQNQAKIIARQVGYTLPPKATLLTFGLTLTLRHYTQLNTLELFYLDEAALNNLTGTQTPIYLLLDLHNVERQWPGRPPQRNYQWLRTNTVLTVIEAFPPYILFRVERQKRT